jgi:hypothetical protein
LFTPCLFSQQAINFPLVIKFNRADSQALILTTGFFLLTFLIRFIMLIFLIQ